MNGRDLLRVSAYFRKLLPQLHDGLIERPRGPVIFLAPNFVENAVPREAPRTITPEAATSTLQMVREVGFMQPSRRIAAGRLSGGSTKIVRKMYGREFGLR
jgi:hypothetical protein